MARQFIVVPAIEQQPDDVSVHLYRLHSGMVVDGFQVIETRIIVVDIEQLVIPQEHIMDLPDPLPEILLAVRHAADGGHRVKQIKKRGLMLLFSPFRQGTASQ